MLEERIWLVGETQASVCWSQSLDVLWGELTTELMILPRRKYLTYEMIHLIEFTMRFPMALVCDF